MTINGAGLESLSFSLLKAMEVAVGHALLVLFH